MKFEYRITLGYLIVGFLWILLSDSFIDLLIHDPGTITRLQTYKGWAYVLVTGILLFFMLRNHIGRLRKAERKAKDSDNLKTAFIQNISHEIRTPMNSIVGFSELLKEKGIDEKTRDEYLGYVSASSAQLLYIINEVMDISLIETGNKKVITETVHLNDLADDVYNTFLPVIRPGIKFDIKQGLKGRAAMVVTDGGKIKQVLGNLLNNSLKFVDSGHIIFGYELKNEEIEFFVEDTGIGVDPAMQEKIFERFGKIDPGGDKIYDGVGLGLAISKGMVELLGGHIWFISQPGRGATFYFTVPYKKPDNLRPLRSGQSETEYNIGNLKILVVEDDLTSRRYISEIFKGTDIEILTAVNGREAVDICRTDESINIILMDLKMPVMDGYTATREIRKLRPEIPIVAQSAFAMTNEREKAMQAGCTDYLAKPYKRNQMLEIISKHISVTEI